MGNNNTWVKWTRDFQNSPGVYKISTALGLEWRVTACCCMEFWSWFDAVARGHERDLGGVEISHYDKTLRLPPGFVGAMIDAGLLSYSGGILTAVDKSWSGSGQRQRKKRRIYFMLSEQTGLIKIGISHNPKERARSLSTTERIKVIGDYAGDEMEERRLHVKFKTQRRHGEWFDQSKELVEFIKDKGFTVNVAG